MKIEKDDDSECKKPCTRLHDLLHILSFCIWQSINDDVDIEEVIATNNSVLRMAKP